MKPSRIVAAVFAGALAAAEVAQSHAQVAAGPTIGWEWPGYGPLVPYRDASYGYVWISPWASCRAGACVDNPYLRRAIRRELAQLEYLRELEERVQRGLQSHGAPLYGVRGDWPPPTPEAEVMPAYRESGEIRPEFSRSGQPIQDSAEPRR